MLQITKPQSSEYTDQADKFLTDTNTNVKIEYLKHGKHFDSDDQTRDIYKITISRAGRKFSFEFGNSIVDSGIINAWGKEFYNVGFRHNGQNAVLAQHVIDAKLHRLDLARFKALTPRVSPSSYSVLACLTKYDCGTFENFCNEFGYDDSRKAKKTYKAVCKEWKNVQSIWSNDEIEQLQEIS